MCTNLCLLKESGRGMCHYSKADLPIQLLQCLLYRDKCDKIQWAYPICQRLQALLHRQLLCDSWGWWPMHAVCPGCCNPASLQQKPRHSQSHRRGRPDPLWGLAVTIGVAGNAFLLDNNSCEVSSEQDAWVFVTCMWPQ